MLFEKGIAMEAKGFAIGIRAEHRRSLIDGACTRKKQAISLHTTVTTAGGYIPSACVREDMW